VNDELCKLWKGAVVACFEVLFRHPPGGAEENHEESQDSVLADVLTGDLLNTSQKLYRLSQFGRHMRYYIVR
jgi:hypothetical protein